MSPSTTRTSRDWRAESSRQEHATFEAVVALSDLHERDFGKDKLVAELKLQDEDTRAWIVGRSEVIAIDLAA